ncbi:MAG TPA: hypothetical protein VM492_08360 [Sumerlaeia bacterium]|nr:hypothetical protein [Sumerlaeia bacterium]
MPSGPGKTNAGIAPFAAGFSLVGGNLGEFFFNPATAYDRRFAFPGPFSRQYIHNRYLQSPLNRKAALNAK